MNTKNILTDEDYNWIDDNYIYFRQLKSKHKQEMREFNMTNNIINCFPDELPLVMQKLIDSWLEADKLYNRLKEIRRIVDRSEADSFTKWFYLNKTKLDEGKQLLLIQDRIKRLERLKIAYEKKEVEKHLSKEYFKTKKEREQYDIDKMFSRNDLLADIALSYGLQLKQNGKLYRGLCPFHDEKTPSFFIYSDNWFHCFGCQKHGNLIDYVMEIKNIKFRDSLAEINNYI